jgi:hypothetical protein
MPEANPFVGRFMKLFDGLDDAYGTGRGQWVREQPKRAQFSEHLAGRGPGLGIGPLRRDGTVVFAAVDLDEPDFDTAQAIAALLPGTQFIERSRSGNAHIFTFFSAPIEGWIARGLMREACAALKKKFVEVFPKQDRLRDDMLGNYLNLPYYGNDRPVVGVSVGTGGHLDLDHPLTLDEFIERAEGTLNDPQDWVKRARWLGVPSPEERASEGREFGTSQTLHMCCEYVIANRDENPIVDGHRAVVYFALAKQLANCELYSEDEAVDLLVLINDSSPDPVSESELRHMYRNAVRGQYTSTGCDDPLFQPYAHPECPISNGGK